MRVFHVISGIENGGVEVLLSRLIATMPRDIEFHIVLHEVVAPALAARFADLGVILHVIPCRKRFFAHRRALRQLFLEYSPEIVHVHTTEWGFLSLEAARRAGVPCRIQHSHAARREKSPLSRLLFSLALWRGRRAATHYFACGNDAAVAAFGKGSLDKGRVTILKNGIDTAAFAYSAEARTRTREALGIGEGTAVIGMVARFTRQKNHAAALKIFEAYLENRKNSVLLLVGDGHLLPRIKDLAQSLFPKDAVRFLGVREDVAALLSAMDVFLLPSRFEGLPITLIEAQAAGLPAVVSDTVTREADFSGKVTFLNTSDAAAFAAALAATHSGEREEAHKLAAAQGYRLADSAALLYGFYQDHK